MEVVIIRLHSILRKAKENFSLNLVYIALLVFEVCKLDLLEGGTQIF